MSGNWTVSRARGSLSTELSLGSIGVIITPTTVVRIGAACEQSRISAGCSRSASTTIVHELCSLCVIMWVRSTWIAVDTSCGFSSTNKNASNLLPTRASGFVWGFFVCASCTHLEQANPMCLARAVRVLLGYRLGWCCRISYCIPRRNGSQCATRQRVEPIRGSSYAEYL